MTSFLLLGLVCVASHKLLNTTGAVDDALLAGVEGVAKGADFDRHHVALDSVYDSSFICLHRRDPRPLVVSINVDDRIDRRMGFLFHDNRTGYPNESRHGQEKDPSAGSAAGSL